jgi:CheY-like chemotaxis protein/DNA-binding XRE family transcriptional regulator
VGDLKLIFGSAVKARRWELGISQEELADRAGLHRTYISDVERGARNLSLESIDKLARALELSVSALLDWTTDRSPSARLYEILLVEDDAHDVELTQRAFQKARIANPMRVVRGGAEALEFLFSTGPYAWRGKEPAPGVILLDLHLPKIGGMEVLRRIRRDKRTQQIPVIVLTVSKRDRDIATCREMGVRSYLVKPVDFRNLSEITPQLEMEWALVKHRSGGSQSRKRFADVD